MAALKRQCPISLSLGREELSGPNSEQPIATNDSEPEFQFDISDEDNYDSLSESEYSDEKTESSSRYL